MFIKLLLPGAEKGLLFISGVRRGGGAELVVS
jgi:hypothetical protein